MLERISRVPAAQGDPMLAHGMPRHPSCISLLSVSSDIAWHTQNSPKEPDSKKNKRMQRPGKGRKQVSAQLHREGSAAHKQRPLPSRSTTEESSKKKIHFLHPEERKKKKSFAALKDLCSPSRSYETKQAL